MKQSGNHKIFHNKSQIYTMWSLQFEKLVNFQRDENIESFWIFVAMKDCENKWVTDSTTDKEIKRENDWIKKRRGVHLLSSSNLLLHYLREEKHLRIVHFAFKYSYFLVQIKFHQGREITWFNINDIKLTVTLKWIITI